MTTFADSSAVVKLYADEAGAELVRRHTAFVVSALARVEVVAAIWRKHRSGELPAEDASVLTAAFEADWQEPRGPFLPVVVSGPVLDAAAALAARHGLRAYDAVQLATAEAAREAGVAVTGFLCFDAQLAAAAAREGWLSGS